MGGGKGLNGNKCVGSGKVELGRVNVLSEWACGILKEMVGCLDGWAEIMWIRFIIIWDK